MINYFMIPENKTRKGCRDVWNAYMLEGATYDKYDIPFCPTTMAELPKRFITFEEAKTSKDYDAGVVFYKDDYKFDGVKSGIWANPQKCIQILSKFKGGVVTPDFAMNQDLPEPWKIFNTYRKQAFGYYMVKNGLKVVNNVRWGSEETWDYCYRGIGRHKIVAVSTLGCILGSANRQRFKAGLEHMIDVLSPVSIIVYGNCPADLFGELEKRGIRLFHYESEIAQVMRMRGVIVNE